MAREGQGAERLQQLRRRIEHWRATRRKHGPMSADLWDEATSLARSLGVCPVSRALGVGYGSLQQRVLAGRSAVRTAPSKPRFLELSGAQLVGTPAAGATIEIVAGDGARLTIKLRAGSALDIAAVVQSFRRRG